MAGTSEGRCSGLGERDPKARAFSVDEAGTLTLSSQARSDLFIDPSGEGERPGAG